MSSSVSDARVFEVTVRILNRNVTEGLLDRGSLEFQNFSQQLLHEVKPGRGAFREPEPETRPVPPFMRDLK